MSSAAAIDFESIEAQVRADAERKVSVLREIVDTHTELTRQRDAFLVDDAERVRRLSGLVAEAKAAGFDVKTLAPFHAEPLATKRAPQRKRSAASRPRGAASSSATNGASHSPADTPSDTASVQDAGLTSGA